jgi:Tfp pilus assembly protein PilP
MTAERPSRTTRMAASHAAGWLALALLASGCGGGSPPTPPPAAGSPGPGAAATATAAAKPAPVALPKEPEPGAPLSPLSYDAKGRRDPFVPIVLAKDKPGLSILTFKLTGVIGSRPPLALVEASDGIGYILKPGDTLGDGRVTEITQSTVTFTVAAKSGQAATTTTLRLAQA